MKIKNTILLLAAFVLFSCSSNNDSQIGLTTSDLVGTWNLTSFSMDNVVLNITDPGVTTISGSGVGKDFNGSITFTENPNQASIEGNFTLELTYTYGQVFTEDIYLDNILFNDTFGFLTSAWTLEDSLLNLTQNGQALDIKILEYFGNKITLETDVNQTVTTNGVTADVTGKAIIVFEK